MKYNIFIDHKPWGTNVHIVAKDGLSFCGIELLNDESDTAYIYCIFVHDSAINKGRGTEILKELEEYIKGQTKCSLITLNAEQGKNSEWYARHGYTLVEFDIDTLTNLFTKHVVR